MPKRSRTEDVSEAAFRIVAEATRDRDSEEGAEKPAKNPAAVALGRLGGLKGGPARARMLSEQRRKEIARKAARARWEQARESES
jgi:hypothetical protein